jgi:hypothetical protein
VSTYYVPNSSIPFSQIKTFDHNGVTVDEIEGDVICLTDGENYLWAELNPELETIEFGEGEVTIFPAKRYECVIFSRFGANNPKMIIQAIEEFFDVELISEYEKEFNEILEG